MNIELDIHHVNKLFELTELHMDWFNQFHSDSPPRFADLLRLNHKRILHFLTIELLGEWTDEDINRKFDRMFIVYNSLFEIATLNRENRIIINNLTY